MIQSLTTLEDSRLDAYVRLTDLQLRNRLEPEKGIFIAESDKVINRALDAGYEPCSLLIPDHKQIRMQPLIDRVEGLSADVPVFVAPAQELETLVGYELTRGVLCAMKRKPLPSAKTLLESSWRVAILENITNHTNVGAIFRSAAALGVDALLITPGCCDPLYRRAIRVSMGTVFQVPWTRICTTVHEWPDKGIALLHEAGFSVVSMALSDDAVSLRDLSDHPADRIALLLGTEGDGLLPQTISLSDAVVKIPMKHGVDSLNVAAASAVAFWELCR